MFFKRNLFACLHLFNNSFLLLRVNDLSEVIMKYFSHKHNLHLLVLLEYAIYIHAYSNNEHLNHDVITPTVLTVTALLYFDLYT